MLRDYLVSICSALLVFFLSSPAQSGENSKGGQLVSAPAGTTTRTVSPEQEVESARLRTTENPMNAQAKVHLGYLLLRQGSLDEAMANFEGALKINPLVHQAKTGKGIILSRKGRLQEAVACLKDALVLNPNPVRTHYELGRVYEQLGDVEKAVAELKEGIRKHEEGR